MSIATLSQFYTIPILFLQFHQYRSFLFFFLVIFKNQNIIVFKGKSHDIYWPGVNWKPLGSQSGSGIFCSTARIRRGSFEKEREYIRDKI